MMGSPAWRILNQNYYTSAQVTEVLRHSGFANVECRLVERREILWPHRHKAPTGKDIP